MSGWDDGAVYYSDQAQFPRGGGGAGDPEQAASRHTVLRKDMRRHANENGESAAVPITVRQLEVIVRLSEALAKMKLSHVANDNHVMEAIRLFNNATMDAARLGINQHMNLSPEMADEIKQAETQIKRRMGIGSHISERRLIDELA